MRADGHSLSRCVWGGERACGEAGTRLQPWPLQCSYQGVQGHSDSPRPPNAGGERVPATQMKPDCTPIPSPPGPLNSQRMHVHLPPLPRATCRGGGVTDTQVLSLLSSGQGTKFQTSQRSPGCSPRKGASTPTAQVSQGIPVSPEPSS